MARRKRDEGIFDLLTIFPWWVSVVVAGGVYVALRYWLPGYLPVNPVLIGVARGLQQNAGLFALFFLFPAPISLFRSIHRRRLLDQQSSLESIRAMSWREFEMLCGEAYRRKGFSVVENGLGGADGGIDLVLRKGGETWLIQCKRWKTVKVGVKEIREMYGIVMAEQANRGVFITSGEYTPDARAFADGKPLDLLDGPALLELVRDVQKAPPASHRTDKVEPSFNSPPPSLSVTPSCPVCGASMVLRKARRGANAGGQFWGCSKFPNCRGVIQANL